jgi:hypothetical protein
MVTMMKSATVARIMKNAGFEVTTAVNSPDVIVSLNRKISMMEVEAAFTGKNKMVRVDDRRVMILCSK